MFLWTLRKEATAPLMPMSRSLLYHLRAVEKDIETSKTGVARWIRLMSDTHVKAGVAKGDWLQGPRDEEYLLRVLVHLFGAPIPTIDIVEYQVALWLAVHKVTQLGYALKYVEKVLDIYQAFLRLRSTS